MNVRFSVPRSPLILVLLLSMILVSTALPMMAGPTLPATSVAPAAAAPAAGEPLAAAQQPAEAQRVSQPMPTTGDALQAPVPDDSELTEDAKQGFVNLDVDVTTTFKAGDVITYTYFYVNTSPDVTASDIAIDVTWSRFDTQIWEEGQYCFPNPESCSITNVSGPTIVLDESAGLDQEVPDGLRVLIDSLGPGESGEFSIQVRTGFELLPLSGQQINQLDSSGALYIDFVAGATETLSEASTSTIAVGPRFVISKREATDMPDYIYAGDEYTFVVTVGNTTDSVDQTNEGQPRADAIDATNVRVRDVLPLGSTFITPTQGYPYDFTYDADEGYVEWEIPRLDLEQSVDLLVEFEKLDTADECGALNNRTLSVTSDEMPIDDDDQQRAIPGRGASVTVFTPMEVQRAFSPTEIGIGGTSAATFTVFNRYTRGTLNDTIENVQLRYEIPPTVSYVADSATPAPSAVEVIDGEPGGIITWTFDIAAADKPTDPIQQAFELEFTGVTPGNPDGGVLSLVLDATEPALPTACVRPLERIGPVVFSEFTQIDMTKELLPEFNPNLQLDPGGTALIKDGDILTYTIQVSAPEDVPNIDISDFFPAQPDVRFEDLSFVGDTPVPETTADGRSMVWSQQSLRANEPLSLTYRVRVGGGEYVRYCNVARITAAPDTTRAPGDVSACYEIRPDLLITKESSVAEGTFVLPGETVAFTLTLSNEWDEARSIELVDALGGLEFVSATSPDLGDGNYVAETQNITWTASLIQPGETVEAFVTARVPAGVERFDFRNLALFRYLYTPLGEWRDSLGDRRAAVVIRRPSTDNTVEYFHSANREVTGLQDELEYRIFLINRHDVDAAENISVEHVLPAGFAYQNLSSADNLIDIEPEIDRSRPDGRVVLRWDLDLAPALENAPNEIRFRARSGSTVGAKESWLLASTNTAEVSCREVAGPASCRADGYATARIEVRALHTLQPRAVDPLPACLVADEELNYRVSFVNNSSREYVDTTLSITLPTSLSFSGQYAGVDVPPSVTEVPSGTLVSWSGLAIATNTQRDIDLTLNVVNADSFFIIQVSADSPTGIIPPENQTGNFLIDPCSERDRLYLPYIAR